MIRSQHLFAIFSVLFSVVSASASASAPEAKLYADHCSHIVPDSLVTDFHQSQSKFLQLTQGYFDGGDPILNATNVDAGFTFTTFGVRNTIDSDVVQFQATMYFRVHKREMWTRKDIPIGRRRLKELRIRGPRIPVTLGGSLSFNLHGFWSARSGAGCAVGSGMSRSKEGNLASHSVVYRFRYLNSSTIETSLVNGMLESLDDETSPGFFKPIHVVGISEMGYKYTLMENLSKEDWGSVGGELGGTVLGVQTDEGFCSSMSNLLTEFSLVYDSDCVSRNCNPLGANAKALPGVISLLQFQCLQSEERVRLIIKFYNTSRHEYRSLLPETSLVGEGAWDEKTNQLHVVACRIVNYTDSLVNAGVGDCSIRLSLMFPGTFSLRNRSSIVGEIWSTSSVDDSSYFDKVGFFNYFTKTSLRPGLLARAKYEYTVVDTIKNTCLIGKMQKGKGRYPNPYSHDMHLRLEMKQKKYGDGRAVGFPLSVEDQILWRGVFEPLGHRNSSIVKISYDMHLSPWDMKFNDLKMDRIPMSAEGTYDTMTGTLCMIGCFLPSSGYEKLWRNASSDCEILINIQFPTLDADAKHHIKGSIVSRRATTDPHYFEPVEVSSRSIYTNVAEESIWRMDIEITLVLVSKTLACIFVGLQLYYTKKWPETPPFMSILMLVVLTLGHMIPLLLNFEALFINSHGKSNVSLDSGGWLSVNEVIVRIVTMVAFLLHFRLLQLTWSCRLTDAKAKGLWDSEKKVVCSSLPVYIGGMLIAWFTHKQSAPLRFNTFVPHSLQYYKFHSPKHIHNQLSAFWGSLKAYGGLVHDGFLLPQILFNMFHNSQEKALARSFYMGTTFLRVFPHLYDLYRDHKGFDFPTMRVLYANHILDFYSTTWNIIIPCLGLLFAAMIYLQQEFGGRCILPKSYRQTTEYEKVPVVINEQL